MARGPDLGGGSAGDEAGAAGQIEDLGAREEVGGLEDRGDEGRIMRAL